MKAWKFGDNIDSDQIISGLYLTCTDPSELAKHVFEAVRPDFAGQIKPGDVIVAGRNFGCGSSRESAVYAIQGTGAKYIIAESFSRIFLRNSINLGMAILQANVGIDIQEGDELEVDMEGGRIFNLTRGLEYQSKKMPVFISGIIEAGGLVNYAKKKMTVQKEVNCDEQ